MNIWQHVLLSASGLAAASLVGSVIGLAVKRIPHKWNDIFMGFCAGTMLAAAIVGLLLPAIGQCGFSDWWQVVVGVAAGVALIGTLDRLTPHLHRLTGLDSERHSADATTHRVLLFVVAIAIHKLPEGMATGIVFDESNLSGAYSVAVSIALQNIPEGMVVVTPLLMIGVGWLRACGDLHRSRSAGDGRCDTWIRVGRPVGDVSARTARHGRRCDALCHLRRNDTRDACSWIPETGYICACGRVTAMLFIDTLTQSL